MSSRRVSRKTLWATTAILTILLSVPVHAADYYFDRIGGLDTNPCTISLPCKTTGKINSTLSTAVAGDRILLKGGVKWSGRLTINGRSGTASAPISITTYGTGKARLQNKNGHGIYVYNSGGISISNMIVEGAGTVTTYSNSGAVPQGIYFFNNTPNVLDYIRVSNVEIYNFKGMNAAGGSNGLVMRGGISGGGFRDVEFTYVDAHDNLDGGIVTYSSRSCSKYDPKCVYTAHSDVLVHGCDVHHNVGTVIKSVNSGNGIVLGSVDGGVIEYSTAHHNGGQDNPAASGGPVGIWAWNSNNVTIQYNESYANTTASQHDGGGFDLDGGTTNSVVQYNYSHDNAGAGFLLCSWSSSVVTRNDVIRYNISENDGRRNMHGSLLLYLNPAKSTVHNNTFYISPAAGATQAAVTLYGFSGSTVRLHNNVFYTSGGVPLVRNVASTTQPTFEANAYWPSGPDDFQFIWNGATYTSYPMWRAAAGVETANAGKSVDPLLAGVGQGGTIGDPYNFDLMTAYRIASSASVLIDKSVWVPGGDFGGQDFYGNTTPQGVKADIGANERQ